MRIGVPKETAARERRVAIVPDVVKRLRAAEHEVVVEPGAGLTAGAPDAAYEEAGATLGDPWGAEVVAKVAPPGDDEVGKLGSSTILVGFLNPLGNPEGLEAIAKTGATALAMEKIPRISRAQSMDALSSQATVSGYRAVLIAATELQRFFPMFMTAAGTVPPAQVLVLGAGVAGPAGDRHRAPARRRRHGVRHPERGQGADPVAGREVLRGRGDRRRRGGGRLRPRADARRSSRSKETR